MQATEVEIVCERPLIILFSTLFASFSQSFPDPKELEQ